MRVTKRKIRYEAAFYGYITTIPKGTQVSPATNISNGGWWVESWPEMSEIAESWKRNYGFHLCDEEIEQI